MIATSFVFILLIAVVSGKSILEMFFGPTVSSESENVCANNSCTCTVNGVCKNDVGTSSSPLAKYTCNGNNGACYCGHTKECHCDGNNGACYKEYAEVVTCEPINNGACL